MNKMKDNVSNLYWTAKIVLHWIMNIGWLSVITNRYNMPVKIYLMSMMKLLVDNVH